MTRSTTGRIRPLRTGFIVLFTSLLTACTWVQLTEAGETVSVLTSPAGASCSRVGTVTSRTKASVAGASRDSEKQRTELDTLARNEAALLGANAVRAEGTPIAGRLVYIAYRCDDAS